VDNIAVGDFNPDMTRVIEVCDKLGMTKFIEQLPHGFNTYLERMEPHCQVDSSNE